MTDEMRAREEAICKVAKVNSIGEVSDGFHTFNGLYEQRMILFATLVKAYKDKAWKSYRHEDGEYCFGGGWFVVGIDTPEGSYTYHYENKYWDMIDCVELPRAKHWDGHTEADAETRLMSLKPEPHWIPVTERLPETDRDKWHTEFIVTTEDGKVLSMDWENTIVRNKPVSRWIWRGRLAPWRVIAWRPLPAPYQEDEA